MNKVFLLFYLLFYSSIIEFYAIQKVFTFELFCGKHVFPIYAHIPAVAIFPAVMSGERQDVHVARVVGHFRVRAPGQYMRNMDGGIVVERLHGFLADVRQVLPAPAVETLVFLRRVPPSKQFPLDCDPQVYFHRKAAVKQRLVSVRPAKVVFLAGRNLNRCHTILVR